MVPELTKELLEKIVETLTAGLHARNKQIAEMKLEIEGLHCQLDARLSRIKDLEAGRAVIQVEEKEKD